MTEAQKTLEYLVARYGRYVGWVDENADDLWTQFVIEALILRDKIADRWAELSDAQRAVVAATDEQLLANRERILAEGADAHVDVHPAARWWWHLESAPDMGEMLMRAPNDGENRDNARH